MKVTVLRRNMRFATVKTLSITVTSYVIEPTEQMCNCFKRQAQGTV